MRLKCYLCERLGTEETIQLVHFCTDVDKTGNMIYTCKNQHECLLLVCDQLKKVFEREQEEMGE